METTTTSRLENPISREDLAHYHSDIVLVTAAALAAVTESEWARLSPRSRARWLGRSLDLLFTVLSDREVVVRLPLLYRSLSWRLS
jgi:acyl-CoA reductase-like NAD-dependent aldehyde dehydrogenase